MHMKKVNCFLPEKKKQTHTTYFPSNFFFFSKPYEDRPLTNINTEEFNTCPLVMPVAGMLLQMQPPAGSLSTPTWGAGSYQLRESQANNLCDTLAKGEKSNFVQVTPNELISLIAGKSLRQSSASINLSSGKNTWNSDHAPLHHTDITVHWRLKYLVFFNIFRQRFYCLFVKYRGIRGRIV